MKYLTGNTNREFTIGGVLVPKARYSQVEIQNGKQSYIELTEELYLELMSSKLFKDLVTTDQVTIHDEEPIANLTIHERYSREYTRNQAFKQQLEAAETRAAEFERLYNEIKGSSNNDNNLKAEIKKLTAENAELGKYVKELTAALEETKE